MTFTHTKLSLAALMSAGLLLTACGGSGSDDNDVVQASYQGKTTPAVFKNLSATQQKTVVDDSIEAVGEVAGLAGDDLVDSFPLAVSASASLDAAERDKLIGKVLDSVREYQASGALNLPVAAESVDRTETCKDGGTERIKGSIGETSGEFTLTYSNCKYLDQNGDYELNNGQVSIKFNSESSTITFKNFKTVEYLDGETWTSTISGTYKISGINYFDNTGENQAFRAEWNLYGTENGKPIATNGTLNCNATGVCTVGSLVTTESGKTYKVEDMRITYNEFYEYDLEATLYHPDYGHYTIEAGVEYECEAEDLSPFVGSATLTSSDAVITYTSESCLIEPNIDLDVK